MSNETLLRRATRAHHPRDTIHKGTPMTFTRTTLRHGKLLVASAFALAMLTTASQAYTQEQQQMCTGDAMRLCASEIPNVDRITACMARQRAQLSAGCKAVFRYEPQASATPVNDAPSARPAKPLNLTSNKRG